MTDNLKGALLMVAAMAGFAVEDLLLKTAARGMPVGQMLMLFGLGGTLAFALLTRSRGQRVWHPAALSPPLLVRAGFEIAGRLFYALAIVLTPLSSASAILQATPLVVVAGAAIFFREGVGWRRWSAIAAGFVGVLLILRPGTEEFEPASILAVLGLLGFAGRDLATRAAPPVLSNLQLGVYGFAILILAGAGMLAVTGGARVPAAGPALALALATAVGVAAYYWLTGAMRVGEVSVVTPFRYTRLIFALILAVTLLGERPDALTLAGAAIVVGSGVYTLLRQRSSGRASSKISRTTQ